MAVSAQKFAELLTQGIHRVRICEGKKIQIIQDELGYALGRQGGTVIEYYRKGNLPPKLTDVETLASMIARRGQMERQWLEAILESAGHPAPDRLGDTLFPGTETSIPLPVGAAAVAMAAPAASSAVVPSSPLPLDRLPDLGALPPGSQMPFARNPLFVGRQPDLLRLAQALNAGDAAVSQVETAATTGLGGIGKSQLACEYVHRYGQFYPGGVFWLSFDNAEAIPAQIAACGGAGAMNLRPDFSNLGLEQQVRLVQAAWQQPDLRLLIFDNCEDPALLTRWRPTSGGCRILLTSRRSDWEMVLGIHAYMLGVLSRGESLALLQKHQIDATPELLDAIAAELGDLPLALHLAGSYLYRYRRAITPEQYLAHLHNPALLQHPSLQGGGISPTGHRQHVARTFALSYEQLDPYDANEHLALRALLHLALFAPDEPVAYELLLHTLALNLEESAERLRGEEAIARLAELGLVEVDNLPHVRMPHVHIHRLVGAFVRDAAQAEKEPAQSAVEAYLIARLQEVNQAGLPLPLLAWQLHLRHVVDSAQVRGDAVSAELATEFGRYLWQIGDFSGALPYQERALTVRLALFGESHAATGASLNHLGYLLRELGDLKGARTYFERALAVRIQALGEEDPDTADTLAELGQLLWMEREVQSALPLLERALVISTKVLGENHLATAECANNVALCLKDGIGDAHAARPYLEQALRIRKEVLGHNHPHTALSYNNMGYLLQELGEFDEARRYYEQALAVRQATLGSGHADTAQTLNNLGALLLAQGKLVEAKSYLDRALATYISAVGSDHYRTSYCLNNLGLFYEAQGKLDQASVYFGRSLAIRQKVYRKDHPATALSHNNLGMVFWRMGKLAEARRHLEAALQIRLAALGEDDPLSAQSYIHLGLVLADQGEDTSARSCYERALSIHQHHPPQESPNLNLLRQRLRDAEPSNTR